MSRMFGERINEFVLSIDIMNHETFFDLLKLIQVYVNQHLNQVASLLGYEEAANRLMEVFGRKET